MDSALEEAPPVIGPTSYPRVLAVVVTHNGAQWLRRCLEAISGQDYPTLDVVVIDNGSDTPAAATVYQALPNAEVLRIDRNAGFGAAANLALEASRSARRAEYFLFIHDDVALDAGCVAGLVDAAMATEAGVVGGKGVLWDQPDVLLEVGMAADQFCYPFTGLEEGEIDQGQHDTRREVLYVTSACCLLSRALIERCGSWDGGYFVFGEDLDLCLRGRMAGFKVVFEPGARFQHAAALSNDERDFRRYNPVRFYTRRNRLRTIAKTAATYRMWAILLLYLVISAGEIFALAALRRFDELPPYPRAIASFFFSLPDVIRRRRAVQKRRALPDRRIRRFMVRDLHRLRIFAERRLRNWEIGTLRFGAETASRLRPSRLSQDFARWIRKPTTAIGVVLFLAILIAIRGILFGEQLAAGGIWPFPGETRRLLSDYLSGWRDVGLGSPAPATPALPVLWFFSVFAGGDPRFTQSVLVVGLLLVGLIGIFRASAERTVFSWARLGAMAAYGLAPLTAAAVGEVDLGALAAFAGAPWIFHLGLRMLRPTPSETGDLAASPLTVDQMSQSTVRLALVSAVVIALWPSGLVALVACWILIGVLTTASAWDRREAIRRLAWVLGSVLLAAILLLPWTIDGLKTKGTILGPLFSGRSGGVFGPLWRRSGFIEAILLTPPSARGGLAALVAPAIGLGALLLSTASRRRESRLFVGTWLGFAAVAGIAAFGLMPPPIASPTAWLMFPQACIGLLTAHLIAGIREELPRHVLGWRHFGTMAVSFALVIGLGAGWIPGMRRWGPATATLAAPSGRLGESISSFFLSNAGQFGEFRILWLGPKWVDPVRSSTAPTNTTPYLLTSEQGLSVLDLYPPAQKHGERLVEETVDAVVDRSVHAAGHLLGPASIRYVVVAIDDRELMRAMRRQRDFALQHQQSGIAVFLNLEWLPRASLAPPGIEQAARAPGRDDRLLMISEWEGGRAVSVAGDDLFSARLPRTYHASILLADNFDPAWRATIQGKVIDHRRSFGWANRFEVPPESSGRVTLAYTRKWLRTLLVLAQLVLIVLAIAMARARPGGGELRGRLR